MGQRSMVRVWPADRPGNGTSRTWSRTLGGKAYRFTAVLMPDGERRYFASVFNGYVGGQQFGCAWSRCGQWVVR
jgi:hypothetical protein